MSVEEEALRYIAQGWSVFPVGGDKQPLIRWGVFRERIADETEVRGWYRRWEHAGVGIATGRLSGLVVLDIDPKHGGDKTLKKLIKDKVINRGDLDTASVETQSGGTHRQSISLPQSIFVGSITQLTPVPVLNSTSS